ncbi:MAG: DNA polymerase III subunit chi, partial [Paracoccaceae bacterium]
MGVAKFYHLTRSAAEDMVPLLLARAYGEGMRVVVRGTDPARMAWLDERLWLSPDEGFLPHGLMGGPHDGLQPVLLTHGPDLPDGASLMAIDGARVDAAECAGRDRVWVLFDGTAPEAVAAARAQWADLTKAGVAAEYWSEESGRWQKKTESAGA